MSSLERNNRPKQLRQGEAERGIVVADKNALRAFEMFVDEHKSKTTIAKELGLTRQTIAKYINDCHDQVLEGISVKAAVHREQANSQLDQIIERWMPLAIHEELRVEGEKYNKKGEREIVQLDSWYAGTKAADRVMKAIDTKAKINGLYTVELKKPDAPQPSLGDVMQSLLPSLQRLVAKPKVIEAEVIS